VSALLVRVVALLVLLLLGGDDEARISLLAEWQEDPLDLVAADPAEIAWLPGMDAEMADALVALRERGELRRIEDLLQLRGLGPLGLEALRPYVRIGQPGDRAGDHPRHAASASWQLVTQGQRQGDPRWRQRVVLRQGRASAELHLVDAGSRVRRGAVMLGQRQARLAVGFLVLDTAGGLFRVRPGRSRLAPAAMPRRVGLRPRSDSALAPGWLVAACLYRGCLVFAGHGPQQQAAGGFALEHVGSDTRAGVAARLGDGPPACSLWLTHQERGLRLWSRLVAERNARGAALGARVQGRWGRMGVDASTTDAGLHRGDDPVTGHRLDRAHRVLQLHARLRRERWAVGGLWRRLWRPAGPLQPAASSLEFDTHWKPPERVQLERLGLRARIRPWPRLSALARIRVAGGQVRISFSQQRTAGGVSEITGASWSVGRGPTELRLSTAWVEGVGSRLWMMSRPGTGVWPLWLGPGEFLVATGMRWRSPEASIGGWIWARRTEFGARSHGIGLAVQMAAGDVVRRLQGGSRPVWPPDARP